MQGAASLVTAVQPGPAATIPAMLVSATAATPGMDGLAPRAEAEGSACSPEGQWNCMSSTWQRCAGGRWSVVMDSAAGTVCRPAGLTSDFATEHEGVDAAGTTSGGPRGRGGIAVVFAALLMLSWAVLLF